MVSPADLSLPFLTPPSTFFSFRTMPRQPTMGESVVLTNSTAFALCDTLLRMAHCLIIELPEPELRDIRYTLDSLLTRTDQVLDLVERDFALRFNGLNVNPTRES